MKTQMKKDTSSSGICMQTWLSQQWKPYWNVTPPLLVTSAWGSHDDVQQQWIEKVEVPPPPNMRRISHLRSGSPSPHRAGSPVHRHSAAESTPSSSPREVAVTAGKQQRAPHKASRQCTQRETRRKREREIGNTGKQRGGGRGKREWREDKAGKQH